MSGGGDPNTKPGGHTDNHSDQVLPLHNVNKEPTETLTGHGDAQCAQRFSPKPTS